MKIIFSRKGFDLTAGGCPSPIFEDGSLVSLPIPDTCGPHRYRDVQWSDTGIAKIVEDLTGRQIRRTSKMHFDPDLRRDSLPRSRGWRPMFGQAGPARTHLRNAGVGPGDLFLFFGWFREVELFRGSYRYVRNAPNQHVIFGWLSVDQCWESPFLNRPRWATSHPHLINDYLNGSSIFTASADDQIAAGVFPYISEELVLTEPGRPRSNWLLPAWMYPKSGRACLTYHEDIRRWKKSRKGAHLRTVGRGQEFVLNGDDYPEARKWARKLVGIHQESHRRVT